MHAYECESFPSTLHMKSVWGETGPLVCKALWLSRCNGANCHRKEIGHQWQFIGLKDDHRTTAQYWTHVQCQPDFACWNHMYQDSKHRTSQLQVLDVAHFKCCFLPTFIIILAPSSSIKAFQLHYVLCWKFSDPKTLSGIH